MGLKLFDNLRKVFEKLVFGFARAVEECSTDHGVELFGINIFVFMAK